MKTFAVVICAAFVALVPIAADAATFRSGTDVAIEASEHIADNLYAAGSSVTSSGTLLQDAILAGGTVLVNGTIAGDVAAAGGTVTLLAPVAGDVRAAGGTVIIQNSVGGDAIIGGGQITIGGTGVKGDVAIAGGTVHIDAPVAKNLKVRAGSVYIDAPIAGNVDIVAESVTLGKNAVLAGDLTYTASKMAVLEDGAVVRGQTHFEQRIASSTSSAVGPRALAAVVSVVVIGKFLALFLCALIVGLGLKRYSRETVARAYAGPFAELGRGFVALVAIPAAAFVLMLSIIGMPFGIIGMLGYAGLLLFTWIVAPIILGSCVHGYFSKTNPHISWKTILLGTVLYSVLSFIPILGWLVQCSVFLIALGTIVSLKFEMVNQWK